jgi:hypothetical protein
VLHIWTVSPSSQAIEDYNGNVVAATTWGRAQSNKWGETVLVDTDGTTDTPDVDLVPLLNGGSALFWEGSLTIRPGEPSSDGLDRIFAETVPFIRTEYRDQLQKRHGQAGRVFIST